MAQGIGEKHGSKETLLQRLRKERGAEAPDLQGRGEKLQGEEKLSEEEAEGARVGAGYMRYVSARVICGQA